MIATYSDSGLTPHSTFGSSLIEPLLVVGVSTFWLVTLPFFAASLFFVKVWETIVALKSGGISRANPLILRRGPMAKGIAASPHRSGSARAAHV